MVLHINYNLRIYGKSAYRERVSSISSKVGTEISGLLNIWILIIGGHMYLYNISGLLNILIDHNVFVVGKTNACSRQKRWLDVRKNLNIYLVHM